MLHAQDSQKANAARSDRKTKNSADQTEQNCFSHHLPDDMPPARAQRLPDRQFPGASTGPDEEQIHEIHSADEEQEEHAGLHQKQRGADRLHVIGISGATTV